MQVFVMRHAEAEFMANSDEERHLTALGKQQAYSQGEWLKTYLNSTALSFDKVLVSPYQRAQETFEQINAVFADELSSKIETWQGITPYGSATLVADYLYSLKEEGMDTVLIISHLPLVSEIVSELYGKRNPISFYPATLAHVNWEAKNTLLVSHKNAE